MKAMILCAGSGSRLKPLTDYVPKCMVRIHDKPILEYNINALRSFGIKEYVINLHHLPETVTEYFGDGEKWGVHITYSYETESLGTAGGVRRVASQFTGTFIVWYGDNFSNINLGRFLQLHQSRQSKATIALFNREDVTASGIVGLDENDRITRFLEKPRSDQIFSHWVNAGIYILEPFVCQYFQDTLISDFGKNVFPELLRDGEPVYGYRMGFEEDLFWIDTPTDLESIQNRIDYDWPA